MALVSDTWRYMIFRITALFTAFISPILSVVMSVIQFAFLFCLIHLYRSLLDAVHFCITFNLTVPLSICVWYKMYYLLCYSWICFSIVFCFGSTRHVSGLACFWVEMYLPTTPCLATLILSIFSLSPMTLILLWGCPICCLSDTT